MTEPDPQLMAEVVEFFFGAWQRTPQGETGAEVIERLTKNKATRKARRAQR